MSEPNGEGVFNAEKSANEELLEVPAALLKSHTGFSFDFGELSVTLIAINVVSM